MEPAACEHEWGMTPPRRSRSAKDVVNMGSKQATSVGTLHDLVNTNTCMRCGAWKGELGAEQTPELYVQHLVGGEPKALVVSYDPNMSALAYEQTLALNNYPVLKEGEGKGGYTVDRPSGAYGPYIVFNQTINDPSLRAVYSDVRFREAMSLAINRDELNEVLWFGLGKNVL